MQLQPETIDPFSIVSPVVGIRKVLDTQFDFTSRIQDTRPSWATVEDVHDDWKACIIASIVHSNLVPTLKIGILRDEV